MNLRDLVETAFHVAWQSDPWGLTPRIDKDWALRHGGLCREIHRSWLSSLDAIQGESDRVQEVLEEVLVWELFVRVTGASLAALRQGGPAGGHQGRIDMLLLHCVKTREQVWARFRECMNSDSEMLRVDRLRRRCARWADLMISPLADVPGALRMAPFVDRCRQFAEERAFGRPTQGCAATRALQVSLIRRTVPNRAVEHPQRAEAFREVLGRCLDLVPEEAFQANGAVKSRRQRLLEANPQGGRPLPADAMPKSSGIAVNPD